MYKIYRSLKSCYDKKPIHIKINLLHSLIICGVVGLLLVVISQVASNILIRQKVENSVKDLFAISGKLDMLLDGYEKDALTIILNQEYQGMLLSESEPDETQNVMRSMQFAITLTDLYASYTTIQKIRFYDTINQIRFDGYIDKSDHVTDSAWNRIKTFADTQKSVLWADFVIEAQKSASLSLLRRVNNYNGRFVGVLEVAIAEDQINQMYRNFESEDMQFLLVDTEGTIVSCSDKSLLGESVRDKNYYQYIATNNNAGKIFVVGERPCLVMSKKYEKLGYRLIGIIPKRNIVEDVGPLVLFIILIGFAGILAATLLVKYTAKRTTQPLEKVIAVIGGVSHGDYSVRVGLQTQDEFGQLGSQLDEMIEHTIRLMDMIRSQAEQKRNYELQNLQMQINPHFLYNSLETVCGIVDAGESQLAIRMIQYISRFYRGVLSGGDTLITVDQEVQITLRYLEIVKIRYRNSFAFDYSLPPGVILAKTPKLILQPLVENAIVHGFLGQTKEGKLRIRGWACEDCIMITITDNGCGILPEELRRIDAGERRKSYNGGGFGIRNIDERIKLAFGERYGLKINSRLGMGTRVCIKLPLDGQGGSI